MNLKLLAFLSSAIGAATGYVLSKPTKEQKNSHDLVLKEARERGVTPRVIIDELLKDQEDCKPGVFDAELERAEFASIMRSHLKPKFTQSYLTIKRGVDANLVSMHREHLLAMCFFMVKRADEGTITQDLTDTLKDCLMSMSTTPSYHYVNAVSDLADCFKYSSKLRNCA